jgi:hypothetical protein
MLHIRNCRIILLAALLIGSAGTAFADAPYGNNLTYELKGTTLVLSSPDPTQAATIYAQAFRGRTDFTDVIFPDNVTQINTKAFENCTELTNVVIPPSVTLIGVEAFKGCSALFHVLCRPYTAPTLGTDAFTGCSSSLKICVPALGSYRYEDNWSDYFKNMVLTVCFLDENDEQTIASAKISQARDEYHLTEIDVFRTLRKAGSFNTMTLPFNVPDIDASPLAGAEVCEFVGATVLDGALQFDIKPLTGKTLTAGTPYLIQWPNTGEVMTHMHFTGITWDNDQTADNAGTGEVELHGFYGKTHINDSTEAGVNTGKGENHLNLFLQGGNQLYWPSDGENANAKMLGFRAWFRINGSSVNGMPVRRGMPATLRIVSTPTGTPSPVTDNPSPVTLKLIENSQLIIIRNGEKYSINGQKL